MGKQKKGKKKAGRPAALAEARPIPDAVDEIVAEWRQMHPDLDVSAIAVVSRINRLAARFSQALEETCEGSGLTRAGYEALAALARAGGSSGLSQTQLMRALALSPGTVSVRVSRLVQEGLVSRARDPENPRGVIVTLTREGAAAFEHALGSHVDTQRQLLEALNGSERETLADLLRRLLEPVHSPAHGVQ